MILALKNSLRLFVFDKENQHKIKIFTNKRELGSTTKHELCSLPYCKFRLVRA